MTYANTAGNIARIWGAVVRRLCKVGEVATWQRILAHFDLNPTHTWISTWITCSNFSKFLLPHLEFTARWGLELQAEVTPLQDGVWWRYLWKGYDTAKLTFKAQGGSLVSLCRSLDIIHVTWVGWWQFMDRLCPVRHCPGAFCYRHAMDQCLQAPSSGLFYSKEYLTQIADVPGERNGCFGDQLSQEKRLWTGRGVGMVRASKAR